MAIARLLKNISLFVDGRGYAGEMDQFDLPKLTVKRSFVPAAWTWRISRRP